MDVLLLICAVFCMPLFFWMDVQLCKQGINFHIRKLIYCAIFVSCFSLLYVLSYIVDELMGWPILKF